MHQTALYILLFLLTPAFVLPQPPSRYFPRPSAFEQRMEQLLADGDTEAVRKAGEQMQRSASSPQDAGRALFYLAQACLQEGFQAEGRRRLEGALRRFRYAGDQEGAAAALLELGILALQYGETQDAAGYFHQAEQLARKLVIPQLLYSLRYHQALLHSTDKERAVSYLREGLVWAEVLKDPDKAGAVCEELYNQYRYAGQNDSAEVYFQAFIRIKEEQGDTIELIGDYSAYGGYQEGLGRYTVAQKHLIRALQLAEAVRDTFSMMGLYTHIGAVFKAQRDWDSALSYARKAARFARSRNMPGIEAANLKNQADILVETGRPAAAIPDYRRALGLFLQLNNPISAAEVQISLLNLKEKGYPAAGQDAGEAIRILREALAVRKKINDRPNMLHTQLVLARLELWQGRYARAEALLQEALRWSSDMDSQNSRAEAYSLLARTRAATGDFQNAYRYQEQHRILQDSILSRQNITLIQELEVKYQAEKKDRALAERQARAEQLEAEVQKKYYQVVLLAVGSTLASLVAGLLFFLFRYNKRLHLHRLQLIRKEQEARRLQAAIEGEEKERKRLARELHDGLGAVLATAKMQISALADYVPAVQLSHSYAKAGNLIDEACRSVREISHNLTPDILEQHGLEFALQHLCDSTAKAHRIEVDFIPYGLEAPIPEPASIAVYRITQELLKNITQHAGACSVIVQATVEDGWLLLIVEDDGRGFELHNGFTGGIGLSNMRSRVAYLGGRLDIDTAPEQGSTFSVEIPLGGGGG
ncbi:MAG: tetratricopeptide repeat protein [Lewinellaceae bacterium]|nr:tetratricopeptide repeat protein [Lewinellaceae bacterium]